MFNIPSPTLLNLANRMKKQAKKVRPGRYENRGGEGDKKKFCTRPTTNRRVWCLWQKKKKKTVPGSNDAYKMFLASPFLAYFSKYGPFPDYGIGSIQLEELESAQKCHRKLEFHGF